MSQDKVTENFDHDEKIRNYALNTTFVLITCDIGEMVINNTIQLKYSYNFKN
jgi:hypothetical protein